MKGIALDDTILREYDVRGYTRDVKKGDKVLAQNLTPEVAEAFGRALGSMLPEGATVAVTSDHRNLSEELVAGLTRGYTAVGVNVVHNAPQKLYGGKPFAPTGVLSWFLVKSGLDGAVQVTGSHNPPEFNGMKISHGLAALYGDDLKKLGPVVKEGRWRADAEKKGTVTTQDVVGQFAQMLQHAFPKMAHARRVVVDVGNGMGAVLAEFLQTKGYQVEVMFPEPHPDFPNHPADPSTEAGTKMLKQRVRDLNAKGGAPAWIGIALDGDGDRSGFVDEDGEVVWPERMAAAFYRGYLAQKQHAGHVLALDVRASHVIRDVVEKAGGKGVFIPAGYPSHRKFARAEAPGKTVVAVSAEASGHFFFPTGALDEHGKTTKHGATYLIDDGIYSAIEFLRLLDELDPQQPARVVDVMKALPSYTTSNELRLYAPDEQKAAIIADVKERLVARYKDDLGPPAPLVDMGGVKTQDGHAGLVEVDGVRLQFRDDSWFVVRMSNTSPNLVLKFEAKDAPRLKTLMDVVRGELARHPAVELQELDAEIARYR